MTFRMRMMISFAFAILSGLFGYWLGVSALQSQFEYGLSGFQPRPDTQMMIVVWFIIFLVVAVLGIRAFAVPALLITILAVVVGSGNNDALRPLAMCVVVYIGIGAIYLLFYDHKLRRKLFRQPPLEITPTPGPRKSSSFGQKDG
jgi:hypothetical protein